MYKYILKLKQNEKQLLIRSIKIKLIEILQDQIKEFAGSQMENKYTENHLDLGKYVNYLNDSSYDINDDKDADFGLYNQLVSEQYLHDLERFQNEETFYDYIESSYLFPVFKRNDISDEIRKYWLYLKSKKLFYKHELSVYMHFLKNISEKNKLKIITSDLEINKNGNEIKQNLKKRAFESDTNDVRSNINELKQIKEG